MSLSPSERGRLIEHAARMIREGGCAVLPTETVYGLFTRADDAGIDLLESLTITPVITNTSQFTLHLSDPQPILSMLEIQAPVARRLLRRLMPGPVRFAIRQPDRVIQKICDRYGISRGRIDMDGHITIRVPDHPVTREVTRLSGHPVVARGIGASKWGVLGGASLELTRLYDSDDLPGAIIDDGPTFYGKGSTLINLWADGRFEIVRAPHVDEVFIMDQLNISIIFVCTGNTCRSPLAKGLAQDWVNRRVPDGLNITIESAGVAAYEGAPASDQTLDVLRERGIDLRSHRSRVLTPQMIDRADIVLTMTPSHAQAAMQIAPDSAHKVFPIDPHNPIADPFGQPIGVYRQVADQLETLIDARLKEFIDE